ncbi:hypothetical protein C8K30_1011121 [Promicromonospora sp. AC04]|uniref:hypothetical protein n=1 Tax=Promicromonospora sp. AC04 TaxID=2135723 RepID=UPI000D35D67B|nr:hypothetical protein [Promicromonospora sp. AC04]PUB32595.1 hypothetical protein C8K30_1011121 [Promicromonospora sp. AC04]
MTRHHTLHAPKAGIRLAVTTASTIVLDPGPDEHARRHNLARERLLLAAAVVMTVVSMYLLRTSEPHERPWTLAAGLLLAALACHAARPAHRTVPASLLEVLEPLRTTTPAQPGQVQQLVWEACDLMAAEARPDTPSCPSCVDRIAQIQAHLRTLTATTAPPRPDPRELALTTHTLA